MADMVQCLLNNRYEIILPRHRADRPEWYKKEGWERERLESLHLSIKEGETVFYVGAEEGDMAALCAMWGANVIMFEPNNKVLPNIKAIWEANSLPEPVIVQGFASDRDTAKPLVHTVMNLITGEVVGDHGFKELRGNTDIPEIKIDTFVKITGIAPNIISLDVEGSEGRVLRGAEATLRDLHPRIYLSLHPEFLRDYGEWGAELRRWIIDLGYKETLLDYPLHEVHLLYE